jgi:MFS family permease
MRREHKRVRLHRNRDFVLFQAGQLFSAGGSSLTTVAYPLLVLALTGSPLKAGAVSFARFLPAPLVGPFAGVAADRFDRKRQMIFADAARLLAIGALAALVAYHPLYWPIPLLAFVEGAGESFFAACQGGALRAIVPAEQLGDAVSVQTGRGAIVGLAGPPLGGTLFGLARALPFAADAASYAFSFVSLLLVRTPFQQSRVRTETRLRAQLAEGFRFLWHEPFMRVTSLFFAIGNFVIPAFLFVVVVVARRHGLTASQIGLLLALFSAGLLVGATLAPFVRRRLSPRNVLRLEQYCGIVVLLFVFVPSVYVLVAALMPLALAIPITDSVVIARRIEITPDQLLGRVEAARATIARGASPLGPLLAGVLLSVASARATVAVFAAFSVVLAVWATLSSALQR